MNKSYDSGLHIPENELSPSKIIWNFGRFAVSADGKVIDQTARFERDLKMHLASVENGNSQDIEEPMYDKYLETEQVGFQNKYPVGSEINLSILASSEFDLPGSEFVSGEVANKEKGRQDRRVIGNQALKLLKDEVIGEIIYSFKGELVHPTYSDVYTISEKPGMKLGQYDVFRPLNSNEIIYFIHKIELLIRCGDKLLYYLDTNNPQLGSGRTIILETLKDAIAKMVVLD
jgi:hypothetical protein